MNDFKEFEVGKMYYGYSGRKKIILVKKANFHKISFVRVIAELDGFSYFTLSDRKVDLLKRRISNFKNCEYLMDYDGCCYYAENEIK